MSILITGANGAVCRKLSAKLLENNFEVKLLTANLNKSSESKNIFYWDYAKRHLQEGTFEGVKTIVHLAGAGIANQRWTRDRKQILVNSRVDTANLIFDQLNYLNKSINKYISASAIGIYPENCVNADEHHAEATDFMGNLCHEWEQTVAQYATIGVKTALFRTGIILEKQSGFYAEIAKLAKFYAAAVPGSGNQHVSWISMDDMVNMYYSAITDDSVEGIYNATAPNPSKLADVIDAIAKKENRKVILPNIPPFVIQMLFGEMSQVILSDKHVVPSKWLTENRKFMHNTLKEAFKSL